MVLDLCAGEGRCGSGDLDDEEVGGAGCYAEAAEGLCNLQKSYVSTCWEIFKGITS